MAAYNIQVHQKIKSESTIDSRMHYTPLSKVSAENFVANLAPNALLELTELKFHKGDSVIENPTVARFIKSLEHRPIS